MLQITAEFRARSTDWPTREINEFMNEWAEENLGHLTVNSIHSIDKFYPGDGKKGSWLIVVFDKNPPTGLEIELARGGGR